MSHPTYGSLLGEDWERLLLGTERIGQSLQGLEKLTSRAQKSIETLQNDFLEMYREHRTFVEEGNSWAKLGDIVQTCAARIEGIEDELLASYGRVRERDLRKEKTKHLHELEEDISKKEDSLRELYERGKRLREKRESYLEELAREERKRREHEYLDARVEVEVDGDEVFSTSSIEEENAKDSGEREIVDGEEEKVEEKEEEREKVVDEGEEKEEEREKVVDEGVE
eukprot:TRINITY_DN2912_c0_g1_i1.p2 TRINITY_DN2912_c0_g1~~TRINITY_DN2912_c0_g1_i1.p2  ORF type:complete len:226 (-),score=102.04 TRINITY_DN2912_c0_g1_i1:128-805(-)